MPFIPFSTFLANSAGLRLLRWHGARSQDGMLFLPSGCQANQMFFSGVGKLSIAGRGRRFRTSAPRASGQAKERLCPEVDAPRKSRHWHLPGLQDHALHWLLVLAHAGLLPGGDARASPCRGLPPPRPAGCLETSRPGWWPEALAGAGSLQEAVRLSFPSGQTEPEVRHLNPCSLLPVRGDPQLRRVWPSPAGPGLVSTPPPLACETLGHAKLSDLTSLGNLQAPPQAPGPAAPGCEES